MLNRAKRALLRRSAQRGMSIVELLVGVAIGLFVVAGASLVASTQLTDNRRLLVETQIQQDLRATADIVTRDLRRAAFNLGARNGVWSSAAVAVERNPRAAISPQASPATETTFAYERGGNQTDFGFRLNNGVIQRMVSANWQDLTDSRTLTVTTFSITPLITESDDLPCPKLCADGTTSCWPRVARREFAITIEATATSDASVQREYQSRARLRNDVVLFRDAANPDNVCPA